MRIFPEMCASTSWPESSFTLNIVLGNASTTSPSTSIVSSFTGIELLTKTALLERGFRSGTAQLRPGREPSS